MQIYHYSRESGELINADTAREDPLLPGQFRLPAFATLDTPPPFVAPDHVAAYLDEQGQAPQDYRDGNWREVIDMRGDYWRTDTGWPASLELIGVTPAEARLTDLEPPKFGKWNGVAWEIDGAAKAADRNAGIVRQIAAIEQQEQPAAQRAFALTGDASDLRAIQARIDALMAQMEEEA